VFGQRAEDEQPGRIHLSIKTRVLKYDYCFDAGRAWGERAATGERRTVSGERKCRLSKVLSL
jgi:hypothetical protein